MTRCMLFTQALAALSLIACSGSPKAEAPSPSQGKATIVTADRATIFTSEASVPKVQAVAWRDGRIIAAGSCEEVASKVGEAETFHIGGRSASAGLVDAHAHLHGLGKALESVNLRGIKSEAEAVALLKDAAKSRPADEWITGRGWDQNLWSPAEFPSAKSLDDAGIKNPIAVRRVDGHALWANSKAMALAGITAATQDPAGGKIMRDEKGNPTGTFIDNAMGLVGKAIPAATPEVRKRRILLAANRAVSLGLTGVHEMGIGEETAKVYRELAQTGELPLRVYAFRAYEDGLENKLPKHQGGPVAAFFEERAVKMFADGALGSRGALLEAPYSDAPKESGLSISNKEKIEAVAKVLSDKGYQLGIHAIGDRANREVLDAYAAIGHKERKLRYRVEHAQVLREADIARFSELGVIASMQPTHATSDMPWAEKRVGAERIRSSYAWRTLKNAGARIAFGSDFPVEKPSPLLGLHAAVNRTSEAGEPAGGWYPEEKLSLEEAITAFTLESAYAGFSETDRGSLVAGKRADLTIYDQELTPTSILKTGIELVVVGGKVQYSSGKLGPSTSKSPCAPR